MGRIIELVLLFFVVRFIVKIIEGFFVVKQVKQNFDNHFSGFNQQAKQEDLQPKAPNADSKNIDKGDYIDYEEVKSNLN